MPSTQLSSAQYLNVPAPGKTLALNKTQFKSNSVSSSSSGSDSTCSASGSVVRRKLDSNSTQSDKDSNQLLESKQLLPSNESTNEHESPVFEISADDRKSVLDMINIFSSQKISSSVPSEKDGKDQSKQLTESTNDGEKRKISAAKRKSEYKNKQSEMKNNNVALQVESKKANVAKLTVSHFESLDTPEVFSAIKSIEQPTKKQLDVSNSTSLDAPKRLSAINNVEKFTMKQLDRSNSTGLDTPKVLSVIKNLEKTSKTQLDMPLSNSTSLDAPKKSTAINNIEKATKKQLDISHLESLNTPSVFSVIKSLEKTSKTKLDVSNSTSLDAPKRSSAIQNIGNATKKHLDVSHSERLDKLRVLSAIESIEKTSKTQLYVSNSDAPKSSSAIKDIEKATKTELDVSNPTRLSSFKVLSAIKSIESGQSADSTEETSNTKSNTVAASNSNSNSKPRIKSYGSSQTSNSKSSGSKPVVAVSTTSKVGIKEIEERNGSKAMTTQTMPDRANSSDDTETDDTYEILPSPETSVGPVHLYINLPSQATSLSPDHSYINHRIVLEKGSVMVLLFHQIDTDILRACIGNNVVRLKELGGQILALNPQFCLLPECDTAAVFIYFTTSKFALAWLDYVRTRDSQLVDLCWAMVGENSQYRGRPAPLSECKALSVTLMKRRRRQRLQVSAPDTEQFRRLTDEVVAPMKEKHGGRTLLSARSVAFVSGDWSSLEVDGDELSFVVTQWPSLEENFKKYRLGFNANEDLNRFCGLHEKLFSKILTTEFDVGEVDWFH